MSLNNQTVDMDKKALLSARKIALTAGLLYLLTFVSIPTLTLYNEVKSANYILGAGPDTAAVVGGILEIIVALAGIGTAVVLFPLLKEQSEGAALGLVASRTLEASTIFVGVGFLLTIVTLRQTGAGADASVASHTLAALYDRIFLLGQSICRPKWPVTGIPAVPVAIGASRPFLDWNCRRGRSPRWLPRRDVRSLRATRHHGSVVRTSGRTV